MKSLTVKTFVWRLFSDIVSRPKEAFTARLYEHELPFFFVLLAIIKLIAEL